MAQVETIPLEAPVPVSILIGARNERLIVLAWRVAITVVGLALWEFASGRLIKPFWISSPSAICAQLVDWIVTGELWMHVEITLTETLLGFVFGAVSGIAVGLALGLNKRLAAILDPFIIAFNSLPKIALAPLFILWFGVGLLSKVVLSTFVVFFLVFYSTYAGTLAVEQELVDVLRIMGGSRM
jgi:NitT/TauT family transport system permease protein